MISEQENILRFPRAVKQITKTPMVIIILVNIANAIQDIAEYNFNQQKIFSDKKNVMKNNKSMVGIERKRHTKLMILDVEPSIFVEHSEYPHLSLYLLDNQQEYPAWML